MRLLEHIVFSNHIMHAAFFLIFPIHIDRFIFLTAAVHFSFFLSLSLFFFSTGFVLTSACWMRCIFNISVNLYFCIHKLGMFITVLSYLRKRILSFEILRAFDVCVCSRYMRLSHHKVKKTRIIWMLIQYFSSFFFDSFSASLLFAQLLSCCRRFYCNCCLFIFILLPFICSIVLCFVCLSISASS